MKMKHTPGPWNAKSAESHGTSVTGPSGISIAWSSTSMTVGKEGSYSIGYQEAAANARLIAAAPDLLAALKAILNHPVSVVTVQLMQDAIAAIEKAGGRS